MEDSLAVSREVLPRESQHSKVTLPKMTLHTIHVRPAANGMEEMGENSVDLIVTSPPYPMIEMWDEMFANQDPPIRHQLTSGFHSSAFLTMHSLLDDVWKECIRVLKPGCFMCINIGDAVRTFGKQFQVFPNAAEVIHRVLGMGYMYLLPGILWRKPTNAPNKFLGSGMLPGGAYVTQEHEHILIFRKCGKRMFNPVQRQLSAYFWEERNEWFSDVWTFPGVRQASGEKVTRRTAAFNMELPFRLIHMYSLYGDTVLDPFMGTGTTTLAAIAAGRSSVGFEIDRGVIMPPVLLIAQNRALLRFTNHEMFVFDNLGRLDKYTNLPHGFPVMTKMERNARVKTPILLDSSEWGNQIQYDVEYRQLECNTTVKLAE